MAASRLMSPLPLLERRLLSFHSHVLPGLRFSLHHVFIKWTMSSWWMQRFSAQAWASVVFEAARSANGQCPGGRSPQETRFQAGLHNVSTTKAETSPGQLTPTTCCLSTPGLRHPRTTAPTRGPDGPVQTRGPSESLQRAQGPRCVKSQRRGL